MEGWEVEADKEPCASRYALLKTSRFGCHNPEKLFKAVKEYNLQASIASQLREVVEPISWVHSLPFGNYGPHINNESVDLGSFALSTLICLSIILQAQGC